MTHCPPLQPVSLRQSRPLVHCAGVVSTLVATAALLALLGTAAVPAAAQAPELGRITGRIEGVQEGTQLAGTRVVLVRFRLNEQGVPEGQPIQTQPADGEGRYAFADVPIEARSVYQIGASLGGQTLSSRPFTFPPQERDVMLNLRPPHVVRDAGAVRIEEGLIAVEPRRGAVWITEVLHLVNPSQDSVEGVQRPLELSVPPEAEEIEMLREIQREGGHERLGGTLLVYGNLTPGRTTVAFRYRLSVWLGQLSLDKRYPLAVGTLSVLVPEGNLRLRGTRFAAQETQEIEGTRYDTWAAMDVGKGEVVQVRLRGVPVRQELNLLSLVGFFLLMAGVVTWFLRRRVPAEQGPSEPPEGST